MTVGICIYIYINLVRVRGMHGHTSLFTCLGASGLGHLYWSKEVTGKVARTEAIGLRQTSFGLQLPTVEARKLEHH